MNCDLCGKKLLAHETWLKRLQKVNGKFVEIDIYVHENCAKDNGLLKNYTLEDND